MDSITQLTLGAAVGETVLGRKIGYKAAVWGAICGTLPDLDNFIPYHDAVATVTYHRSFTHSLLVLALAAPVVAWLIRKIHPQLETYKRECFWLVFLVFETHALLDAFTVYGTQLLWPIYEYPFSGSTIFIIDPAYTFPLIIGVLFALILSRQKYIGHYMNYTGLFISSLYLVWTVGAKCYVDDKALYSLVRQDINFEKLLSTPAPFNSILWRLVVITEGGYYEGYYSILDNTDDIEFKYYRDEKALLVGLEKHWPVQRLKWFTHGFYSVQQLGNDIVISDLRMGAEPNYAFKYKVAEISSPQPRPLTSTFVYSTWQKEQLDWIWWRLKNPRQANVKTSTSPEFRHENY